MRSTDLRLCSAQQHGTPWSPVQLKSLLAMWMRRFGLGCATSALYACGEVPRRHDSKAHDLIIQCKLDDAGLVSVEY